EAVAVHPHVVRAQPWGDLPVAHALVPPGLDAEAGVAAGVRAVYAGPGIDTIEEAALDVAVEAAGGDVAQRIAVGRQAAQVNARRSLPTTAAIAAGAHPAVGAGLAERKSRYQARCQRLVAPHHPAVELEAAACDAGSGVAGAQRLPPRAGRVAGLQLADPRRQRAPPHVDGIETQGGGERM